MELTGLPVAGRSLLVTWHLPWCLPVCYQLRAVLASSELGRRPSPIACHHNSFVTSDAPPKGIGRLSPAFPSRSVFDSVPIGSGSNGRPCNVDVVTPDWSPIQKTKGTHSVMLASIPASAELRTLVMIYPSSV